MIHPAAVIHPGARIGSGTRIGPFAVIDAEVSLGENCELGPHVYVTGRTEIGDGNRIHAGAVIGDLPQDLRFSGEPTRVQIGNDNVIREHVTIHRSNNASEPTRIGSGNLLMAHAHVGHNAWIGDHTIIANGALVAGHVTVEDRVFISGNCLVHQFVRIGMLALMQGGSGISKDLPPFTVARGNNGICGLNTIGLRRAGFTSAERLELRELYQVLFRREGRFQERIEAAEAAVRSDKGRTLIAFLKSGRRGFCGDTSRKRRASAGETSGE